MRYFQSSKSHNQQESAISQDKPAETTRQPQPTGEERGVLTDVVAPIAQSAIDAAVSAGVGAYVGHKIGQAKTPTDPPK